MNNYLKIIKNKYFINLLRKKNTQDIYKIYIQIKDKNIRIKYINYINPNDYNMLLKEDLSDEELIYIINNTKQNQESNIYNALLKLQSDNNKIKYYDKLNDDNLQKIYVIASLKDNTLKLETYDKMNHPGYCNYIFNTIKDKSIIVNRYKDIPLNKKIMIIRRLEDDNLKKLLINTIKEKRIKEILSTNIRSIKLTKLKNETIAYKKHNIDPDLTIGIELELHHRNNDNLISCNKMLKDWTIKEELSVDEGLEITSPPLHFKKYDLLQLKYVCDFIKKNYIKTGSDCGGHIHFGFKYIESNEHLLTLIQLFSNTEKLIYIISNRCNTIPRNGIEEIINLNITNHEREIDGFAKPISNFFTKYNCLEDQLFDIIKPYYSLPEYIKKIQDDRYFDINFQNINCFGKNTIEFRGPNCEIDFDELLHNIVLFGKILETSKYLSKIDKHSEKYQKFLRLSENMKDEERLNILLDLLFDNDEEKQIYLKRYNKNTKILKKLSNCSFNRIKYSPVNLINKEKYLIKK